VSTSLLLVFGYVNDVSPKLPLVSVVVPVFNGAKYLRESLDSLLRQTYSAFEILVMDDASTDDTPAIAKSYGEQVTYIRQGHNLGIYDNVNAGIARCRGELIAVYHADDVYEPTIIEREVAFLQAHADAGAVFCMDTFVDADGRPYHRLQLVPELRGEHPLGYAQVLNALLTHKNTFFICPSAMVRAEVYQQLGGYNQQRWHDSADLEMWLRIASTHPIGILEDQLMRYRHGHGNASARYQKRRTDEELYFQIMDEALEAAGCDVVTARSQAAYRAHRDWDRLRRSINHYILDQRSEARDLLRQVRTSHLLGSRQVQRFRLVVLTWGLRVLLQLPRIQAIADFFDRRWNLACIPRRNAV